MQRTKRAILTVSGLTIQREGTHILREIDWRVEPGQHWAILGANGSGKTSLLSALTGYLMATKGEICVLNRKFGEADWRELRQHIGLVSSAIRQRMADDEPAVNTVVSGKFAMIDMWGTVKRADRARAMKLLQQTECGYLAERAWLFLSQGERQRVLIARALMAKPQLLILDEPCAGLDPAARENFLQFLQRLGSQRGAPTLVLVTHHVEEIVPAFTHALVLKSGEVLASGEKRNVLNAANLSKAFHAKIKLTAKSERYALTVMHASGRLI